jgi:membrane peptidoglycan carboxypeptidase
MAIGQEVSVTLLQMSLAFASIANDGILISPRICKSIVYPQVASENISSDEPHKVRRVVTRETARRLRFMLSQVVGRGTGRAAALAGISIAGKTGTSQKVDSETGEYSMNRVYASFIGFLPSENPVLLCAVVIDEPAGAPGGGTAAAPAFQKVITQIISNPDLHYAERILGSAPHDIPIPGNDPLNRLPDVCGMTTEKASDLLRARKIDFEIIGSGHKVVQQSFNAGEISDSRKKLIVYTRNESRGAEADVEMPSCIGKDLRDAVNAVSIKGLTPFVAGAGTVYRQYPEAGIQIEPFRACSLFCAIEG